jgi:hypothetical protein
VKDSPQVHAATSPWAIRRSAVALTDYSIRSVFTKSLRVVAAPERPNDTLRASAQIDRNLNRAAVVYPSIFCVLITPVVEIAPDRPGDEGESTNGVQPEA